MFPCYPRVSYFIFMFAFPAMWARNELLLKSQDSHTLNNFSWWISKENIHYQATRNKISSAAWCGQCSSLWGGFFECLVCDALGWLADLQPSSRDKVNTGSLRSGRKSMGLPHYCCRWVGDSTGSVHLFSQEFLLLLLTLKQCLSMLLPWQMLYK